jgi:hypothetical protein
MKRLAPMNLLQVMVFPAVFICLTFMQSCGTMHPKEGSGAEYLDVFVREREELLRMPLYVIYNTDSSYAIVQPARTKGHSIAGDQPQHIMVVKVSGNEVILDEIITGGSGKWLDNNKAELFYPGGFPGGGARKIFDVTTGKIYTIKVKD